MKVKNFAVFSKTRWLLSLGWPHENDQEEVFHCYFFFHESCIVQFQDRDVHDSCEILRVHYVLGWYL